MFHASLAACFGGYFSSCIQPRSLYESISGGGGGGRNQHPGVCQISGTPADVSDIIWAIQHLRRLFPSPHIVSRTWRPDELEPSVLSYKAEQNVQPGPLVRSHLQYNDWRLPQLRNYEVPCDAEWIWGLVPPWTTFTGHGWQLGVLSQRVNTRPVSGARFSPSLLLTHFPFHPL